MTQTGYSNAVVNAMLGWLKGLASWVLKLFNLSGGVSPLKWLADHWLELLIVLLVIGVALDLLIWLIRWRPHWVWFRKRRVIINDKNFFADERSIDDDEDEWEDVPRHSTGQPAKPRRDWEDSDFVVASDAARKTPPKKAAKPIHANKQTGKIEHKDVFQDDLFNVSAKHKFSDIYEDEVFNVSNLPRPARRSKGNGKTATNHSSKNNARSGKTRNQRALR